MYKILVLYQCYVPVKSKLQHPPSPQAFGFVENFFSKPPPPSLGQKDVQISHHNSISGDHMPLPSGKLSDYCFNFSVTSIMVLKLCI